MSDFSHLLPLPENPDNPSGFMITPEAVEGFEKAALRILRRRHPDLHWRSLREADDA